MALVTRKGNPMRPPRVLIYGVEGVGKSTFGARAEAPLFITPEGGTDRLTTATGERVDDIPGINSWDALLAALNQVLNEQHSFKTLVLDSADWIEQLAHSKIIGNSGKDIIRANGGYGSGYRESQKLHSDLIKLLDQIRDRRNMNIVVTAHAHVKEVKDPSAVENYDAFEIKCHELVSSLWREWVDALFFVRFKTVLKTAEDEKARAFGDGSRVLYTQKQPAFQAKNRYGLAPEYEFTLDTWNGFVSHIRNVPEAQLSALSLVELKKEMDEMMGRITDETMKSKIAQSIEEAGGDEAKLRAYHKRLKDIAPKEIK